MLTCKRNIFRPVARFAGRCGTVVSIAVFLLVAGCATCEPRPNLGLYKQKLTAWYDSGGYARCFSESALTASRALQREISKRRPGDRIVVVLDIDETCLSNWGYLTHVGFDVDAETFRDWVRTHNDPALQPTLELFRQAKAAGVPVFLVTGRRETLRKYTERQLRAAGFDSWDGLYLAPVAYNQDSIVPFKSGVREKLTKVGWRIVLNMGDQWSDLEGGYAVHAVKLPNPYYFIR